MFLKTRLLARRGAEFTRPQHIVWQAARPLSTNYLSNYGDSIWEIQQKRNSMQGRWNISYLRCALMVTVSNGEPICCLSIVKCCLPPAAQCPTTLFFLFMPPFVLPQGGRGNSVLCFLATFESFPLVQGASGPRRLDRALNLPKGTVCDSVHPAPLPS
ncbi:unnamed protein product [Trypanosoma congolense IL3000]|uniref:WGS project CAEQ00000000 data, annotated contig 2439 n=1 Tax=Trypanosoma congolense (strain IL3000) TaxID=1068625 RepID=F9WE50_TRYCI|nr:unnamed protein product [Trypanosoma congolense IL3000]